MVKKTLAFVAVAAFMCVFALPTQAQFGKGLGKSLGKAAGSAGQAVAAAAGDMAGDMVAGKVATKLVDFMDNNNTVLDANNAYTKRLNKLVDGKYTNVDGLTLNYKVYENPEINILANADGSIRVYTGMMDFLNDEELLATISTKIGHIANKDTRDMLMKAVSEDNAGNAGTAQLEKLLSMSGDKLGTVVNELLQVPYSAEQSKEADEYATKLLKKNGAKGNGLASALSKFAALEEEAANEDTEDANALAAAKFLKVKPNNSARASMLK